MEITEAYSHVSQHLTIDVGSFFSPGDQLSLGVGKIYTGIRFPIYNEDTEVFSTAVGKVYVLTHECDVDQNNARIFNEDVLICPLIDFVYFIEGYSEALSTEALQSFLVNLAQRNISRVLYLPPIAAHFQYGALMYLNHITNTHISAFSRKSSETIAAVTGPGLRIIDQMLENHLLRPKAERLALTPEAEVT